MFAEALKTTPSELMGWESEESKNNRLPDYDNIFPVEKKKIPMLGEIACGEPILDVYKRQPPACSESLQCIYK